MQDFNVYFKVTRHKMEFKCSLVIKILMLHHNRANLHTTHKHEICDMHQVGHTRKNEFKSFLPLSCITMCPRHYSGAGLLPYCAQHKINQKGTGAHLDDCLHGLGGL